MKLAYSIFYTNDISTISDFYKNTLEFEKAFGDDHFVAFKIGDALLGIKKRDNEREVPGHQTVIIEVKNVDQLYKFAIDKKVTIFSELQNASWGRNFSVLDSDKNKVEFFEPTNNFKD